VVSDLLLALSCLGPSPRDHTLHFRSGFLSRGPSSQTGRLVSGSLLLLLSRKRDDKLCCHAFLGVSFRNLNVNTPPTHHFESRIVSYQHPFKFSIEPWVDVLDLRNCVDNEVPLHVGEFIFAWVGSPRLSKVLVSTSKARLTQVYRSRCRSFAASVRRSGEGRFSFPPLLAPQSSDQTPLTYRFSLLLKL
jgi:hypothetical protein